MQGSETGRRPSLLNECRLSDGRLAWPVAQSSGVSEATFRKRLKSGLSPDEAATRPVPVRDLERIAARRQERRDYQAQRAADADMRRKASKRPARFGRLSDAYAGVIWSDDSLRVVVSPRGGCYAVQYRAGDEWRAERSFPSASALSVWLWASAEETGRPGLSDAVAGLSDDPAACDRVLYRRSASA